MSDDMDWPGDWYPVEPGSDADRVLTGQLRAEMAPGHILEAEAPSLRLLARLDGHDDALFALRDGRVAQVHMTWRQTRETDRRWPAAAIHDSLDAWLRAQ